MHIKLSPVSPVLEPGLEKIWCIVNDRLNRWINGQISLIQHLFFLVAWNISAVPDRVPCKEQPLEMQSLWDTSRHLPDRTAHITTVRGESTAAPESRPRSSPRNLLLEWFRPSACFTHPGISDLLFHRSASHSVIIFSVLVSLRWDGNVKRLQLSFKWPPPPPPNEMETLIN